jgi:hypothetical protein
VSAMTTPSVATNKNAASVPADGRSTHDSPKKLKLTQANPTSQDQYQYQCQCQYQPPSMQPPHARQPQQAQAAESSF